MFDLGPAATRMRRLVEGVPDDRLDDPTPCPDWSVRDLVGHVNQFTLVFTANAGKAPVPADLDLPDDWRSALPARLDALAQAWREESVWEGRVSAGGIEMSAEDNAYVGVEELVLHGWDLARATGQDFEPDDASLDGVERFLEIFAEPIESGQGPYTGSVDVPADAPRLHRILGTAGRDPDWSVSR